MNNSADTIAAVNLDLEANYQELPLLNVVTDVVPGEGSNQAQIVFIGEAPGYYETVERRPFVGKSGQLFRGTLKNMGLEPSDYYITNIVKARPPDNRDPTPAEIAAYRPYLNRELAIIKPTLIVTLGRFSMAKFLPTAKISMVHGRLHKVKFMDQDLYILPMYHPAAALRSSGTKLAFEADFKKIPAALKYINDKKISKEIVDEVENLLT
jgi:DNA polymerase